MKISARSSVFAGVIGLAAAGIWSSNAGCGSSSNGGSSTGGTSATGGSSATGGNKATGGSSSTGGSTGTGGVITATGGSTSTGGASATGGGSATGGASGTGGSSGACTVGTAPTAPLLADFDAATVTGNVVSAGSVGKIYPFPSASGPTLSLSGTTNQAMTVTASVPGPDKYWGASLSFNQCIDATAYTGVKFKLSAVTLAGCELRFGVDIAEDVNPTSSSNPKGTCTATACYGPASAITATTAMVPFADLMYGSPVETVNKKTIVGIAWTLHSPAAGDAGASTGCTNATFTVDDVSFY